MQQRQRNAIALGIGLVSKICVAAASMVFGIWFCSKVFAWFASPDSHRQQQPVSNKLQSNAVPQQFPAAHPTPQGRSQPAFPAAQPATQSRGQPAFSAEQPVTQGHGPQVFPALPVLPTVPSVPAVRGNRGVQFQSPPVWPIRPQAPTVGRQYDQKQGMRPPQPAKLPSYRGR